MHVHKVLTTPADPALGALTGLGELLARGPFGVQAVELLVHSTTLVTNSIIERHGAPTALLCTEGFRDVLEMRREQRYDLYDLFLVWPEPLVPRDLRLPIGERMSRDGHPLRAPEESDVLRAVGRAIERGARSVAVAFLHSYADPSHERAVGEIIRRAYPELTVTLSSDVAPVLGEYERTSTTVADAYVAPVVRAYLARLRDGLKDMGFTGQFFMTLSSGAAAAITAAIAYPIRLVESGPAAGAAAAALIGTLTNLDPVLSFDMGGTTAKVCLIEGGTPTVVNEVEVARAHRLRRGSGLPLLVPSVELIEIGAGGGSIARVDETGILRVGPASAGARPGPACYGMGGREATVTDANLLLGYLDPAYFLGGDMRLDASAAHDAIATMGSRLGLTPDRTAAAIHDLVNETMAEAARMHLIERNWDPRKVALVAFGGAGPAHAAGIARKLGIDRLVFPVGAGATSALGSLVAPLEIQHLRSVLGPLNGTDWPRVNDALRALADRGRAALLEAKVDAHAIELVREADMHIRGQVFEITVPIPDGILDDRSAADIKRAFGAIYRRLYSRHDPDAELEVVNWKVTARAPRRAVVFGGPGDGGAGGDARKGDRLIYSAETGGVVRAAVYDRYRLVPGTAFAGPAVVEEREATVIIPLGGRVVVDDHLDLVVDLGAAT